MKKKYVISLVCFFFFLFIMILVLFQKINFFDDFIYEMIYQFRNDFWDTFFITITKLGNTISVIVITLILLCFLAREDKILLVGSLLVTTLVNQGIKYLIQRPRPPLERRLVSQGGFSFPSGHTMGALCLYGILLYFVALKVKRKSVRYPLMIFLIFMAISIGISRIYVGVHYPSDVLAGYLLEIPILILVISFLRRHFKGEGFHGKDVHQ